MLETAEKIANKLSDKIKQGMIKTQEQLTNLLKIEIEIHSMPYLNGGDAVTIKSQIERIVTKSVSLKK
ncbi:hypothetical protein D3C87_2080650 [compost metagenome]